MAKVPKLWFVQLLQALSGKPRVLQATARDLGLETVHHPTVVPNTPSNNELLKSLGSLVHFQPLVIAPRPYPYADHPFLAPNGVFYPPADKLEDIHRKYGDSSEFLDIPSQTHPSVKDDIVSHYKEIFSKSG